MVAGILFCTQAFAWQGFNMDTGTAILVNTEGKDDITTGNVVYFDYDEGLEKIGYLNMYENNLGLLVDLDTGELIRIKMEQRH